MRLLHGTSDAVMFLSVHISRVLLLGLSGTAHLQLRIHNTGKCRNKTACQSSVMLHSQVRVTEVVYLRNRSSSVRQEVLCGVRKQKEHLQEGLGISNPHTLLDVMLKRLFFLRGKSSLVDVRSPNYFILARSSGA